MVGRTVGGGLWFVALEVLACVARESKKYFKRIKFVNCLGGKIAVIDKLGRFRDANSAR
jgi:hypothetical protein